MKNIPQNPNILYSFVRAKLHDGREKTGVLSGVSCKKRQNCFALRMLRLSILKPFSARRSAAFRESGFKCFCFLSFFIISIEKPS